MTKLKIVSLNANGLGNSTKRRIIFSKLRAQRADICLIQETHSSPETGFLWAREWGGQIFYFHSSPSSKGVAILLDSHSEIKVVSQLGDKEGRFLALQVTVHEQAFTICTVYSATQDKSKEQADFFKELDGFLSQLQGENIILEGDFNCIRDTELDKNRPGPGHPQSKQGRGALNSLLEEWDLEDTWRSRNLEERAYPFRRGSYSSSLDFFLTSTHLSNIVDRLDSSFLPFSDHALISIQVALDSGVEIGPGFWRFNPELLQDTFFVAEMEEFLQSWEPPPEITSNTTIWEWLKQENEISHETIY